MESPDFVHIWTLVKLNSEVQTKFKKLEIKIIRLLQNFILGLLGPKVNAVELMASVGLIRVGSVDSTGKELMDASHFCDSTRDSEVEYDYDTSVSNNTGYHDILGECSRGRGDTQQKDLKLNSVGECALLNLPLPNI